MTQPQSLDLIILTNVTAWGTIEFTALVEIRKIVMTAVSCEHLHNPAPSFAVQNSLPQFVQLTPTTTGGGGGVDLSQVRLYSHLRLPERA